MSRQDRERVEGPHVVIALLPLPLSNRKSTGDDRTNDSKLRLAIAIMMKAKGHSQPIAIAAALPWCSLSCPSTMARRQINLF
jgi:hypothetical protein